MDKQLERSLKIIKDEHLERSLSIVVGGYLFSLGAYLIWCFYFLHGEQFKVDYIFVIVLALFAITAVYLFSYFLILYIKSFQKVWTSFFFVSIITLLIFFLIPSTNHLIYYKFNALKKIQTEKKRMVKVENKLKFKIAMNDASKKLITEPQTKLKSERKENERSIKRLDETIRKTTSLDKGHKTKGDVVLQTKSNNDFPKINSETGSTDLDTKNHEIIFKVQIITSDTPLAINSQKFKGIKNVWEYNDGGLYKYTVGNEKDLKSASVLQAELRSKGFVGAFVVAFKNGRRIPVREAIKLLN